MDSKTKGTLIHVAIAAVLTLIGFGIGYFSKEYVYAGAGAGTIGWLLWELAQAEERWLRHYKKVRSEMPWHAPFWFSVWDLHSVMGFAAPGVAVVLLCVIRGLYF